ncbi:glycosyltransferase family 2 protein [Enterovirga rhinocerotis]|uniref:Glycosyl transferase family 2 n=1 Tax=Enterovirga rhinocerotis TaxID=1339210 RepID=A0A4R7C971_9HYPH|nr:glycosyltransferase family A protein [Enterovirga rhinocerotis]TDR93267.1 glycosyl transferase family 2 [Enterovirga rhinocerotis]
MSGNRLAVIVATKGRAPLAGTLVDSLFAQTRPPETVIVVGSEAADLPALDPARPEVTAFVGRTGSSLQRNDGLALVRDTHDVVAFFDDDFIPSRFWLDHAVAAFAARPDLGGLTGIVLADGAKGPGIALDEGRAIVAEADRAPEAQGSALDESFGPYGCNMAFRTSAIAGLSFDEALPLYAWLEDFDFGGQIRRRGGRTARAEALWGVHLGNKTGRERGARLGYSQIANAAYLARKGNVSSVELARLAFRNLAANAICSLRPEPHVDRAGRLRGNLLAVADLLRGRIRPERILDL